MASWQEDDRTTVGNLQSVSGNVDAVTTDGIDQCLLGSELSDSSTGGLHLVVSIPHSFDLPVRDSHHLLADDGQDPKQSCECNYFTITLLSRILYRCFDALSFVSLSSLCMNKIISRKRSSLRLKNSPPSTDGCLKNGRHAFLEFLSLLAIFLTCNHCTQDCPSQILISSIIIQIRGE